jgi:hypothetical protein
LQRTAVDQSVADSKHGRDLSVVPTRVDRARMRVVVGVFPDQKRVKLAEDSYSWAGAATAFENGFDAGESQTCLHSRTKGREVFGNQATRGCLFEAQLRRRVDLAGDADNLVLPSVDRAHDRGLDLARVQGPSMVHVLGFTVQSPR